jgi:hypothetical protein
MRKVLVLGVVAVLLASALVLVSCGPKCPDDKKCSWDARSESLSECSDLCIREQGASYMNSHPDAENPPNLSCNCGS